MDNYNPDNYYSIVTDKGKAKMAAAVLGEGKPVSITKIVIGDGNGTTVVPNSKQTELVNQVWEGDVTSYIVNGNEIRTTTTIPIDTDNFVIREAGIIDEDGDLIAVSSVADIPWYPSQTILEELEVTLAIQVDNADSVTFTVKKYTFDYAYCRSGSDTIAKEAICDEEFGLYEGQHIYVVFDNSNTAEDATLNVNQTGAYPIFNKGEAIQPNVIAGGETYLFVFDGEHYNLIGDIKHTHSEFKELSNSIAELSDRGIVYDEETWTASLSGRGTGESGGGDYVLPVATKKRLGGVIVGDGLDVKGNGEISLDYDGLTAKTDERYGGKEELQEEVTQRAALGEAVSDLQAYIGYTEDDIYGLEVDFKNNRFTRLAGAVGKEGGKDFDNIPPWNRRRCILADDGTVVAYYGDEDYAEDGSKGQVMVEQPLFYIKVVPLGAEAAASGRGKQHTKARYYISATPKAGFEPMHGFRDDNGVLQGKIYLSAYEACIQKEDEYLKDDEQTADFERDRLSSIAGAKPASGLAQLLTRANTRKLANNRGDGWQLHNIFALSVSQILMLIEYASFDCQSKVGNGVSSLNNDNSTNMAVITGGTSSLGNVSGNADNGDGTSGQVSVSYRGEENIWGNIYTWLDGINVYNNKEADESAIYLKEYGEYTDDIADGYDRIDFDSVLKVGYQSALGIDGAYPELSLPTEAKGTSTLPIAAYWWNDNNGWRVTKLGGNWLTGAGCSAWCLTLNNASSNSTRHIGGRLLYIPQYKEDKTE